MKIKELLKNLEAKIQKSYEEGVTLEEAERLAGEFLHAQLVLSGELTKADLDSRMKKSGVKAIKGAIYLEIVQKAERKPTEAQLTALIDSDKIVVEQQEGLDKAEVSREELHRYYDIFLNAHIHFRNISRSKFE